jgi:hypothetical protein
MLERNRLSFSVASGSAIFGGLGIVSAYLQIGESRLMVPALCFERAGME